MACEPFDCEKCGQQHKICAGHHKEYTEDTHELISMRPCRKPPLKEAAICDKHGGNNPRVRENALRKREEKEIRAEVVSLGIRIEVDPIDALLNDIWETVGNIEFYRSLVQELPTHPEPDEIVGENKNHQPIWKHGEPGIYGKTFHQSGLPTGEAKPHVLIQMYNDERKHLVTVTSAAIRLGIEEHRLQLEESRATEVFRAVTLAMEMMGLSARSEEFRGHFASAVRTIRSERFVPASIGAPS